MLRTECCAVFVLVVKQYRYAVGQNNAFAQREKRGRFGCLAVRSPFCCKG